MVERPTRDRLLDAALDAFAARGVDGTPITDLEHAAGLAAGSGGFYRYFKTKDELLEAVVRREVDRARQRQIEAPAPEGLGRSEAMAAALHSMLAVLRSQRPLIRILARHPAHGSVLAPLVETGILEAGLQHDAARLAEISGEHDEDRLRVRVAVIVVALVGHVLATDYFGHPAGALRDDEVVATLAELLGPETHPSSL